MRVEVEGAGVPFFLLSALVYKTVVVEKHVWVAEQLQTPSSLCVCSRLST